MEEITMLKSEFEKIPNGTIFKIPGVRKVFVKAQVYFGESDKGITPNYTDPGRMPCMRK